MPNADRVRELLPELRRDLEDLVRIPSVSVLGEVGDDLLAACAKTEQLFKDAGVATSILEIPNTAPITNSCPILRGMGETRIDPQISQQCLCQS